MAQFGLRIYIFCTIFFIFDGSRNSPGITVFSNIFLVYRIYSIKRPRRLLNFWTLRVGAYSRLTTY